LFANWTTPVSFTENFKVLAFFWFWYHIDIQTYFSKLVNFALLNKLPKPVLIWQNLLVHILEHSH
jgi:hypothetical protein